MFDDPIALMTAHPGLVLALVFVAGLLEHVFPPFWGDTLMLAGFFMAGLGRTAAAPVYVAALLGSCVGAAAAFGLGRRLGAASLRVLTRSERARRVAARAEAIYAAHGPRVLAINRFLPGLRAFLLPMAGMGRLPFRKALLWSSLSNVAWCAMLLVAGLLVGRRTADFGQMEATFRTASQVAAVAAGVVLVATLARFALRRRCSSAS